MSNIWLNPGRQLEYNKEQREKLWPSVYYSTVQAVGEGKIYRCAWDWNCSEAPMVNAPGQVCWKHSEMAR